MWGSYWAHVNRFFLTGGKGNRVNFVCLGNFWDIHQSFHPHATSQGPGISQHRRSLCSRLNKVSALERILLFFCSQPFREERAPGRWPSSCLFTPVSLPPHRENPIRFAGLGGELLPAHCSPQAEKWSFCMLHAGWSIPIPWRFPGSAEHIHSLVSNLFLWFAQLENTVIILKEGREEEMRTQGQERGREKEPDAVIP